METVVISHPNDKETKQLGQLLAQGELVAIPTETVYGLGANGLDPKAIQKIYAAKGRPSDNPLILHVPGQESVPPLVEKVTPTMQKLMDHFWPGSLTLTIKKSSLVPEAATGGLPSVALRCPDNTVCRKILAAAGVPVAAPSANISGRPSPTTAEAVYHDMGGKIAAIADDGPCQVGIESTVVEVGEDCVTILRPGAVTEDMLLEVVSRVEWDKALVTGTAKPKAPGMKYTHYAPDAPMTTYVGDPRHVAQAMAVEIEKIHEAQAPIGLLLTKETSLLLTNLLGAKEREAKTFTIVYDEEEDCASGLAKVLYEALLTFNSRQVQAIMAEGVASKGLGDAVMNRLDKASGHTIIHV